LLRNALSGSAAGVEVLTIDKVQGRDMEVVLMSLVRSNYRSRGQAADGLEQNSESFQVVGSLLREWRRINVAVTRARAKLLVIGSGTFSELLNSWRQCLSCFLLLFSVDIASRAAAAGVVASAF
jgi:superfamily I DNA and/or RNA helicase